VEHPVTEAVTGLDLVEWQLRVAAGEPLPLRQGEIVLNGAAMEARLYAEDPSKAFLPSTGPLTHFRLPTDLRVDSAVEEGGAVTPYYDPMIAKLIAHADTREEAVRRLADACAAVEVWPVKTNAGFLARLLSEAEVRAGGADTGFIERAGDQLTARPAPSAELLAAAAALTASRGAAKSPWSELTGFRLNAPNQRTIRLEYDQTVYGVEPALGSTLPGFATRDGAVVFLAGEAYAFSAPRAATEDADAARDGAVRAPMPGKIVAVHAAAGEGVTKGQPLVTLEAMKMEHALTAPFDGVIAGVFAQVGDQVTEGAVLARVEVQVSKK
jgi:3-methylcrotonyl-CoA carboxylase alpha subunit